VTGEGLVAGAVQETRARLRAGEAETPVGAAGVELPDWVKWFWTWVWVRAAE